MREREEREREERVQTAVAAEKKRNKGMYTATTTFGTCGKINGWKKLGRDLRLGFCQHCADS